jgi:dTDP-L-rhamnose 4-epimerase
VKGERVLVTGGAGFIGSHLVDELLRAGYPVRVLDSLLPQVHPDGVPSYLSKDAELRVGDVRDPDAVSSALQGADIVVHLAAAVGVGQSMYQLSHYCAVNVMGTACLLEAIVRSGSLPRRLIVASSMSIYGEGLYECSACGPQTPQVRPRSQLARRQWAMLCPSCGGELAARPTPENKPVAPTSVYAINKRDQEEMVLTVGRSLGIPAIALRFFNVYGDRQALSNPYTGVAAIFSSCLLNGHRPPVFEDGLQARDFVHVSDIVQACMLSIERDGVADDVFNVGTGTPTSLMRLLELLRLQIPSGRQLEPEILGRFREGDIRACYADIARARQRLGFEPRVSLDQGVGALAQWVATQASVDRSQDALRELDRHRLIT